MNTKVREFFNEMFGEIRTYTDKKGYLWFVGKDICSVLGTKTKDLPKVLKGKGIDSIDILTNGGIQKATIISEQSLYKLIFKSRKPIAEPFQDWIYEVVIPTLRKDGMYVDNEEVIESREKLEKEIEKRVRHKMERLYGKDQRFSLTEELSHLPFISPKEYASYTNVMYNAIFGYKAKELYEIFNAKKGKLRDEFSTDLIILIREAEKFELNLIKSGITDKNMIETLLHNWKESYIKDYVDFKIPHYN